MPFKRFVDAVKIIKERNERNFSTEKLKVFDDQKYFGN
jgi:hypothetical protein